MNRTCTPIDHLNRRGFLKGLVGTSTGAALANWGTLFNSSSLAADVQKKQKRCILLWMAGGPSQIDTFDMKPGRPTGGLFRPMSTRIAGTQVCEYLPRIADQIDKLCVIRSMSTANPEHSGGTYLMHTGYQREPTLKHPELGAMAAKFLGQADSDLPSFVQVGGGGGESSPNAGAGFLGPAYQPFRISFDGRMPENTSPYLPETADQRRGELLRFVEQGFEQQVKAAEVQALRNAQEKSWRLLKAKGVFDIAKEWPSFQDLYGESGFGKCCLLARRLVETGVSFVEIEMNNYDSHEDNFEWHKAHFPVLDAAWSGLLKDLAQRGLLDDTLVVWMGEFGRTPQINNRAGRDHFAKAWTVVLAGGGVRGGATWGETDIDGRNVKDNPVSEGDLFATIYTALGISPKAKHFVGSRPVWAAPPESKVVKEILS